jgi:competence ComEA-like helix-hairpin-helix protein
MQRKEKIVILLFILIISLFTAVSFHKKLYREELPLAREELLKSTRAQQVIMVKNRIDINKAGRYTLTKLPGIGPKFAERIIDYRNKNNGFTSKEQLLDIKGIGPKKYEAIKNRIDVNVPE